jgi:LruC domain-containing protein
LFFVDFILEDGMNIQNIYLFVGSELKQLPMYNNGMVAVDHYPYLKDLTNTTTNKYTIVLDVGVNDFCYLVSAQLEITDQDGKTYTIWMGCVNGGTIDAFYINKNIVNGLYVGYCYETCEPIDYTFAFEDLIGGDNDADYNDLVIQAKYYETVGSLNEVQKIDLVFYARARGALYDHDFKIDIPVVGKSTLNIVRFNSIGIIESEETLSRSGEISVSLFPSTKEILPPNGNRYYYSANTDTTRNSNGFPPCLITSWKTLVSIQIQDPGSNILGQQLIPPYDPYMTVKPTDASPLDYYDLHIYEVTGSGTFMMDGQTFPNGIIVPSNWSWPLEQVLIYDVYPDFPESDWYNNLDSRNGGYYTQEFFGPPCQKDAGN